MFTYQKSIMTVGVVLTALACGGGGGGGSSSSDSNTTSSKASILTGISDIALSSYTDSLDKAVALETQIDTFINGTDTNSANLTATREAWVNARWSYGQTEAFRLTDDTTSPIDGSTASGASGGEGPEGQLNAWPLDETLIDNILADSVAGQANIDTSSSAELSALNGLNDNEDNVATGYHAIEYLLWGADTSALGAGDLQVTAFTTDGTADRRKEYLKSAANLLVTDLTQVLNEWKSDGDYRATFLGSSTLDTYLDHTLTGLSAMSKSELAGERIGTFVGQSATTFSDGTGIEEEHSCFSDQTHRDIYLNFLGIHNLLTGTYASSLPDTDGALPTVVDALTDGANAVTASANFFDLLSGTIKSDLEESLSLAKASVEVVLEQGENSSGNVFDQLVVGETANTNDPGPVFDAVIKLQNLGDEIVEAASSINISVTPGAE